MSKTIYTDSINKMYESIKWTHKIQRTYLEVLCLRRKALSITELLFSSLTSVATAVSAIFNNRTLSIIFALATFLSFVFAQILEKVETKENVDKFTKSSEKLWELKCEIIAVADEIKGGKLSDFEINTKLSYFEKVFSYITSGLKPVPNYIVNKASIKLKGRKDEEVEEMLL